MNDLAKIIIILGAALILIGLVMLFAGKLPFFGKLPGDIIIKRDNFTFYFPITTSIIISLILSVIFYLIGRSR